MTTLLIADHDNVSLKDTTARALTAAKQLNAPVHILIAGHKCGPAAAAAATLDGVSKIMLADNVAFDHAIAESTSALIASMSNAYDAIVSAATSSGKNTLPRVAALLDVMQISDVLKIISPTTFERPIYAGNAIQTVQSRDPKIVMTVRTAAFDPSNASGGVAPIESASTPEMPNMPAFKGEEVAKTDRPDLTSARIVISGGRSLGSADNFKKLIAPVADMLGAAMGASRAAVDAGYAPNDWQVGQTGKVVAPDLYIAVGISGAIQHLAGMKDSKVIVAINTDEEAPIFQVADYGLVADLFEALPKLESALASALSK